MDAAQASCTSAPPSPIRLRTDVFDALTLRKGATSEVERARLLDINRTTLYRIRIRRVTPTLQLAMRIADRLDSTVDELFEVAA